MTTEVPPKTHSYDFIIAGSGAAGLGLAYEMALSPLRGQSILLVDRDAKTLNDRTWSFLTEQPTRFDHLVYHTWDQVEIIGEHYHQVFDIRPYLYKMIRGIDFYTSMREALASTPGVHFMQARVSEIGDTQDKASASVIINEEPYAARFAFDSIFKPSNYSSGPKRYHYLKQHFKGWEIETPTDCFDPQTVTLFDFRIPQKGNLRFFHILPLTRRRAMIKLIVLSADLLKPHEYDRAIAEYLEEIRQIRRYRTDSVESGVIPITDHPFPRRLGRRVMAIGTRGGMVKPIVKSAFLRMQKDAAAIVESLTDFGHPFQVPETPRRYHLFASLFLQMIYRQGDQMKEMVPRLFQRNTVQEIFRFLDETDSVEENVRLLSTLPAGPLLKAFFRVKLLRKA